MKDVLSEIVMGLLLAAMIVFLWTMIVIGVNP